MNTRSVLIRSVIGSFTIGLIIFILLASLAPDAVPYSGNNYGWNGMQQIDSSNNVKPISSLSDATPSTNSTLLIVAPSLNYSKADVESALNFLHGGGTIVIADGSGDTNSLLAGIGANIRIDGRVIVNDPLYNWNSPVLPIILVSSSAAHNFPFLKNVRGVAFNSPSPLIVDSPATIVGSSSPFSVEYNATSGVQGNASVRSGQIPVMAVEKIDSGKLLVIGGSTIFTNSVWQNADNKILSKNIISNSTVYLDTSHWPINVGESIKAQFLAFYDLVSVGLMRYVFVLGAIGVAVVLLPVYSAAISTKAKSAQDKSSRKYDEKILKRIRKDRERYGVRSD